MENRCVEMIQQAYSFVELDTDVCFFGGTKLYKKTHLDERKSDNLLSFMDRNAQIEIVRSEILGRNTHSLPELCGGIGCRARFSLVKSSSHGLPTFCLLVC